MTKKNVHITPHPNGGWQVKESGNTQATSKHTTQLEAITYGREKAINQQTELFIHRTNGQIRERNSFGNDPYPPQG